MLSKELDSVHYEHFNDPQLDAFITTTMEEFPTAGMAVLVVHGDQILAKAYGYADIMERIPTTPETLFFTGSTTKSFTASIAAHLVESPEYPDITWQTPLAKLISEDFVLASGSSWGQWATDHVTIEDALAHRTGMPRHDTVRSNGDPSIRDTIRALRHLPMRGELRSEFRYTNIMYTAVVHAVETTIGLPFGDLLAQHIFRPLQMNATSYSLSAAKRVSKQQKVPLARGYLWSTSEAFHPVPFECIGPSCGAGGINSSVLDYSRWVRHLMKATNQNYALSTNAVKALRRPRMLKTFDPYEPLGIQTYGFGLNLGVYRNKPIMFHGGAAGGYMATMLMMPALRPQSPKLSEEQEKEECEEHDLAVVVLQNTDSKAHRIVAWHLLDKFMKTPEGERRNLLQTARRDKAKKLEEMQPGNILKSLFGVGQIATVLPPALPLCSYEGLYHHVAYHDYRVSLSDPKTHDRPRTSQNEDKIAEDEAANEVAIGKVVGQMYFTSGSPKSYLDLKAVLHHVSGEWWYQYRSVFVNSLMSDNVRKLQFVVGPSGNVEGLRTVIEKAMGDDLVYFQKIS